jgi:ABC-type glycerol-3-phosphate transport system substrate-binding protein
MMEAAALKGLLHPIDDMTESMTDSDWYEYAHQLARLQDSTFGLPFAGDAMIMVYHSTMDSEPPRDFATALETPGTMAFPAADPQALFTLALYQATGGAIFDDQGRPFMDANNLEEVLTFYHNAAISELMPFWLTQYETDEQSWEAFLEDLADMVITWTTRYIDRAPSEDGVAHIPTPDGRRYTLATGWVWALVSPNPERQELSVRLAEFLTESDFLAEWTSVNGYLPPRPSALTNWKPIKLRTLISGVSSSAQLIPPADVLTSLGPPLEEATVQVLKLQSDPHTVAEDAAESLARP